MIVVDAVTSKPFCWKSEVGRRLDALIVRTSPGVAQGGQTGINGVWQTHVSDDSA